MFGKKRFKSIFCELFLLDLQTLLTSGVDFGRNMAPIKKYFLGFKVLKCSTESIFLVQRRFGADLKWAEITFNPYKMHYFDCQFERFHTNNAVVGAYISARASWAEKLSKSKYREPQNGPKSVLEAPRMNISAHQIGPKLRVYFLLFQRKQKITLCTF